jgi:GlpG protein
MLIAFACVGVYIGVQRAGAPESSEDWRRWGVCDFEAVREGDWWAPWSSCLVHVAIWHLAFNLYWLWQIGVRLEAAIGTALYVLFTLAAAGVSSVAQLVASDATGYGYSGVGYALFGFAWVARSRYGELRDVAHDNNATIFVLWLAGCFVATQLESADFGNAAHVAGLVFGGLCAFAFVRNGNWAFALASLGLAALAVGWSWRPWSPQFAAARAWAAQIRGDDQEAERWYRIAIAFERDDTWLQERLAHLYFASDRKEDFERLRSELSEVDPSIEARVSEAAEMLREAREEARKYAGGVYAEYGLGRLALNEWRHAQAREHFLRQLAHTPEHVGSLVQLVWTATNDPYATPAQLDEAATFARQAVEVSERRDPYALCALAEIHARKGSVARACELAREIERLFPSAAAVPDYLRQHIAAFRAAQEGL